MCSTRGSRRPAPARTAASAPPRVRGAPRPDAASAIQCRRPGSWSARGKLAADQLLADALGNGDPGIGLRVLLRRAGAGGMRGLAVVLAGLGDAVALLHVALRLRRS